MMRLHELIIENHLQFIKKRWHYRECSERDAIIALAAQLVDLPDN